MVRTPGKRKGRPAASRASRAPHPLLGAERDWATKRPPIVFTIHLSVHSRAAVGQVSMSPIGMNGNHCFVRLDYGWLGLFALAGMMAPLQPTRVCATDAPRLETPRIVPGGGLEVRL